MMLETIFTVDLQFENDVVQARQRAREIAASLGFDHQEQIRIATATSEIARNAFRYATRGRVIFSVSLGTPQSLQVEVEDKGGGILALEQILAGRYKSQSGMGMGILGTKRLMDKFAIHSSATGTAVLFAKHLPKGAIFLTPSAVGKARQDVTMRSPESPYDEIQQQNAELMKTLSELRTRQEELALLNRELEDTNRGVVALYAELEDRADYLRRTAELKSGYLSNMSHEFRTPLNSIISLTRMLGESPSNPLGPEQQIEVVHIQNSAKDLLELVNDLLDMAKIEAGKLQVKPKDFEITHLFGALRGMLKPLLSEASMVLIFEEPEGMASLHTDEGKLSQILRNLTSNAIKFTRKGEIRISAVLEGEKDICFTVADTGIGIAHSDLETIFNEFGQIDNDLQTRFRGTGLGLPLSQNLASLLGGSISVKSQPGVGSVFSVKILRNYVNEGGAAQEFMPVPEIDRSRTTVLVLEDNHETQFLYRSFLEKSSFQMIGAISVAEARRCLEKHTPALIVCDLFIDSRIETEFIRELRERPDTRDIPILAISTASEEQLCLAAGATAFRLKPVQSEAFLDLLHRLTKRERTGNILLIDDEEASRYILRQHLPQEAYVIREARTGREGLTMAKSEKPDLIFLDLNMPDLDGYSVLSALKQDPDTRRTPVVIHTSQTISDVLRSKLSEVFEILPKSALADENAEVRVAALLARAGITTSKGVHV
ncbi:MAG: hybrid histidine kinase [Acidobacteriales bacterium]|nr:hybrid histidine kinase [Terriglobales bacterium]